MKYRHTQRCKAYLYQAQCENLSSRPQHFRATYHAALSHNYDADITQLLLKLSSVVFFYIFVTSPWFSEKKVLCCMPTYLLKLQTCPTLPCSISQYSHFEVKE